MSLEVCRSKVADVRDVLGMLDTVKSLRGVTSCAALSKAIDVVACVKGLPFACAVLTFLEGFFPDAKHNEIMAKLDDIVQSIQSVRQDIVCLGHKISWQGAMGRYFDAEIVIKQSVVLVSAIGTAKRDNRGTETHRLVEFCKDGKIQIAVKKLMEGVCGQSLFGGSILDDLYNQTQGHKQVIIQFAARLLELIFAGMITALLYEMVQAQNEGHDALEVGNSAMRDFAKRIEHLQECVNSVLRKCDREIKVNMRRDLEIAIDEDHHRSNKDICVSLSEKMTEKYGHCWLCVVVYKDITGFHQHCFNGSRVSVLHRHNKCAIVFFLDKTDNHEGFCNRALSQNAADKVDASSCRYAERAHEAMMRELDFNDLWGLAVIKRYVDLWYHTTDPTSLVWKIGSYFNFCVLMK